MAAHRLLGSDLALCVDEERAMIARLAQSPACIGQGGAPRVV